MRSQNAVVPGAARDGACEGADSGHGAVLRRPRPARRRHDAPLLQTAVAERQRPLQRDAGHYIQTQRPGTQCAGRHLQSYYEVSFDAGFWFLV